MRCLAAVPWGRRFWFSKGYPMAPAYLQFALSLPQIGGAEKTPARPRAEQPGSLVRIAQLLAHPASALKFKAAA